MPNPDKTLIGKAVIRSNDRMEFIVKDVYTKQNEVKLDIEAVEHYNLVVTVTYAELLEKFEEI